MQCWSRPRQPRRASYWSPVGQVRIRSKRQPILELKIFKNQLWHGLVKGSFFRSYYGTKYLVNFCRKYLNKIDTGSMLVNCEATNVGDIFNFCGLLRISEL